MARRDYRDDAGNKLPGVTTIISATWHKPFLQAWNWKEGKEGRGFGETMRHAGDVGSCAHAMIENDLRGLPFENAEWDKDLLYEAGEAFKEFIAWKRSLRLVPVELEKPIVSREFRCGATLDCVGWLNGNEDLVYLDWKTSSGCYPDHVIQGAAYRSIWNETQPRLIRSVHIVRFPKDGRHFEHHEVPESEDWEIPGKDSRYPHKMPSLERGLRIFRQLRELYDERLAIGEV